MSRSRSLSITLVYSLAGGLWALVSERVARWLGQSSDGADLPQIVPQLVFVLATTPVVFWLARYAQLAPVADRRPLGGGREPAAPGDGEVRPPAGEGWLRSVVEGASEAIFVEVEGRFIYVNPACLRLFGGMVAEDLLGQPIEDRFEPGHGAMSTRTRRERCWSTEPVEETVVTLADERVPVEACATPFERDRREGSAVFLRSISKRKQREDELERLRSAIEQAAEAIVITDTSAAIQYVNPAFERTTGYSRDEALGKNPRMLQSGEHGPEFYRELWDTLTSGRTWRGRFVNERADGARLIEDGSISPVRDHSGRLVAYVAVKRDVTRELDLEGQLVQAQRLESLGRLAGGIAHDFNNMLAVISGYTALALDEAEPDSPVQSHLFEIRTAAERSVDLVSGLLAFARKQPASPRVIDLNGSISSLLRMLQRLVGEDIILRWEPSEETWPVRIDSGQLDQILTNLVVNSRDALPSGGAITIETGNLELDAGDCAGRAERVPGPYARFVVRDDGCGMDGETLGRIFDPFFSTKPASEGTGLGLAMVYGLVRQNDGFIDVTSEEGRGTTVGVYLPRFSERSDLPTDVPGPAELARGTETVLLVEDEMSLLELAERILEDLGYEVLSSSSPSRALELAERYAGEIDLLLTDVVMPEMSGPELFQELTALRPGLRCLFISGYPAELLESSAPLGGAGMLLQKPFSARALSAKLRQALEDRPSPPVAEGRPAAPGE